MSFIQNEKKCIRLVIMVINTQDGNSCLLLFIMLPGVLRFQKKKSTQCCTVTVMSSELSCLSDLLSSTLLGSSKINHEKELTNNFKTKSKGEIRTTVLRDSPFHFKPAISDAGPL